MPLDAMFIWANIILVVAISRGWLRSVLLDGSIQIECNIMMIDVDDVVLAMQLQNRQGWSQRRIGHMYRHLDDKMRTLAYVNMGLVLLDILVETWQIQAVAITQSFSYCFID